MESLINLYFANVNCIMPLLNRLIFQTAVSGGLHKRDTDFGATVLLVCAIGSRYSDDPRVRMNGTSSHWNGWMFSEQVHVIEHSTFGPASLYVLQVYCVCFSFGFIGDINKMLFAVAVSYALTLYGCYLIFVSDLITIP